MKIRKWQGLEESIEIEKTALLKRTWCFCNFQLKETHCDTDCEPFPFPPTLKKKTLLSVVKLMV